MRHCFILGAKRCDYFHLGKVRAALAEPVRFVALYDKKHADLATPQFRGAVDRAIALDGLGLSTLAELLEREFRPDWDASGSSLVCADEELLFTAAHLRERFRLPGARPESLVAYKTKRLMKQSLAAKGLRAPRFVDVDALHSRGALEAYFTRLARLLGTPFIVKPIDGGASENTAKVASPADLARWFADCFPAAGESTAEEYVDGEMFCCDGIVKGGEPVIHEAWRYLAPCLEFMSGKGIGGIPLRREDPLRAGLLAFNKDVLDALACPDGAFHNEYIVKAGGEIVFIEAAARPPGNLNPLVLEKNFGVNPYEALLRLELGLALPVPRPGLPSCAYALLPARPGLVGALSLPELASRAEVDWCVKPGDSFARYPRSIAEGIAAKVVLHNTDYARLEADLFSLRDHEPY